jgi:hypothetical protein
MEVIKRVPAKEDHLVAQTWLKNNQPIYSWYRSFLNGQGDIIRSRVAENLDPKRWKVFVAAVKSLYDIMHEMEERYPELLAANICNLDETNLTP